MQTPSCHFDKDWLQFLDVVSRHLSEPDVIQAAAGRNFGGQRFGPRPLDLDIIAYGPTLSDAVADNSLKIPHARWHERDFVKAPITDLYSLTEIHGMGLDSSNILARAHETWDLLGGTPVYNIW